MPDNAEQEPSIEEILASIRQIISDDDAPAPAAAPAANPTPPSMPVQPAPSFAAMMRDDDVLELSEVIEEPKPRPAPPPLPAVAPPPRLQIDMRDSDEEPPQPAAPVEAMEPPAKEEPILGQQAAAATLQSFAKLSSHMALDRSGTGGTTIEDILRDLLKPMLKTWLDVNLPPMIEKLVQKELDRIARRAD